MKLEDFKNGISAIQPDPYMETRITQNVYEAAPKRRNKRKLAVAAVSGILSLAVLVTGLGFGGSWQSKNSSIGDPGEADYQPKENAFILSVYANETDEPIYTQINDDTVTLPDFKLTVISYSDDSFAYTISGNNVSFEVKGENIKSVRIQSEINEFDIVDYDKIQYLTLNNKLYDLIVPYSDEYAGKSVNERVDIMFKHIENGDYDEYIGDNVLKSKSEYADCEDIIFDGNEHEIVSGANIIFDEKGNKTGVGLISVETFSGFSPSASTVRGERNTVKEYTFQNLFEEAEFSCSTMMNPLGLIKSIMAAPNTSYSQLPHDTVKVEVTFNDGSVKYGEYDLSLNDSGELVINTLS